MISALISSTSPLLPINLRTQNPLKDKSLCPLKSSILCSQQQNLNPKNTMNQRRRPKFQLINPVIITPSHEGIYQNKDKPKKDLKNGFFQAINHQMMVLCGFGYYVNGFRCFPWLALNFHMAHNLNMQPSTLQLVQNSGNLPMAAKPLYGILSDALYIGGAHRIPYVSIGGESPDGEALTCVRGPLTRRVVNRGMCTTGGDLMERANRPTSRTDSYNISVEICPT